MAQVKGKPHIHLMLTRQYRCSNYAVSGAVCGYGNTPAEAFHDWEFRWADWQRHNTITNNLNTWVRGR